MSDTAKVQCACQIDRQLPPGCGVAIASLMGLGGYVLAACALIVSGSWFWTLLTWLLASAIGLSGFAAVQCLLEQPARRAGLDPRCRSCNLVQAIRRKANV